MNPGLLVIAEPTWNDVSAHSFRFSPFRGLDGEAWPSCMLPLPKLVNGLADRSSFQECLLYWRTVSALERRRKISLLSLGETVKDFIFLGFDCGYYESEYNNFSAVYNDLVMRDFVDMRVSRKKLNASMLFSNFEDAKEFLSIRNNAVKQGLPLEDDAEMQVYSISCYGKS